MQGPMADFQQLMQFSQQMHRRLESIETELASQSREFAAGGGLVRVTVDGRGTVRALVLDPEAFTSRDAEFVADMMLAAIAEGQRWAADLAQSVYAKLPDGSAARAS